MDFVCGIRDWRKIDSGWPESEDDVVNISSQQLSWLLAGLDIGDAHKKLHYKQVT